MWNSHNTVYFITVKPIQWLPPLDAVYHHHENSINSPFSFGEDFHYSSHYSFHYVSLCIFQMPAPGFRERKQITSNAAIRKSLNRTCCSFFLVKFKIQAALTVLQVITVDWGCEGKLVRERERSMRWQTCPCYLDHSFMAPFPLIVWYVYEWPSHHPRTTVPPHSLAEELATRAPKAVICSCLTLNSALMDQLLRPKLFWILSNWRLVDNRKPTHPSE